MYWLIRWRITSSRLARGSSRFTNRTPISVTDNVERLTNVVRVMKRHRNFRIMQERCIRLAAIVRAAAEEIDRAPRHHIHSPVPRQDAGANHIGAAPPGDCERQWRAVFSVKSSRRRWRPRHARLRFFPSRWQSRATEFGKPDEHQSNRSRPIWRVSPARMPVSSRPRNTQARGSTSAASR